ncbi:putative membrane protein [Cryobacterium psychrotolerans]|nr:putative membrane protein [Cryobacterium psychrotolerans]
MAPLSRTRNRNRNRDRPSSDRFGRLTEAIARGMGTPWFLLGLTLFVVFWMGWNTLAPIAWRFDSVALGFIALTLVLSMQASYAAPMILLAQNRQDDRDRVQFEQDRQRAERNLADTEYLAREVVALRLGMKDLASRDFLRSELRALLENLEQREDEEKRSRKRSRKGDREREIDHDHDHDREAGQDRAAATAQATASGIEPSAAPAEAVAPAAPAPPPASARTIEERPPIGR